MAQTGATIVVGPFIGKSQMSGQIDIPSAGTAVQGPNIDCPNGVFIKALRANTGNVYVGNDGAGDVTTSNGFELDAGEVILIQVSNLSDLWFDAGTSGDDVCWIKA